jgi:hypothetical protein
MTARRHDVTLTRGRDEWGPHWTWTCSCRATETSRRANRDRGTAHAAGRGTVTDAGFSPEVPPVYRKAATP